MCRPTSAKKLRPGLLKKTIVEKFVTAGHSERNVRHDCITGTSGRRVRCFQFRGIDSQGKSHERKDEPLREGEAWSARLYNPFRMARGAWPEEGLYDSESESESESDDANPNEGDDAAPSAGTDAGPSGTTVAEVETSPLPATPDGFSQDENPQDVEFFDTSELPPDTSIWWLSEDAIQLFSPRAGETTINAVENRMKLCLAVFQGAVPIEDVLQGHNAHRAFFSVQL